MIRASLIVLRTANLEPMLTFYGLLGLTFIEEQHGTGPIHHSCELGGLVVEIYPGKLGEAPDRRNGGATMIGFQVEDLDQIIITLTNANTKIVTKPQTSPWGKRAVVLDPDGRAIELNEPPR